MRFVPVLYILSFFSCTQSMPATEAVAPDSTVIVTVPKDTVPKDSLIAYDPVVAIDTKKVLPERLVAFAIGMRGVPYKYASTDPSQGFDCSGFITYVFNHFNIAVPRSSVDFTNAGTEVPEGNAKTGDLILFTGTDSMVRVVGHMGIVTENTDSLRFVHSTSGKANGVTITALNNYYRGRFVKITRIFPDIMNKNE